MIRRWQLGILVAALVPAAVAAQPTVSGNTISWPADSGWWQVQRADTYSEVCNGGSGCMVECCFPLYSNKLFSSQSV